MNECVKEGVFTHFLRNFFVGRILFLVQGSSRSSQQKQFFCLRFNSVFRQISDQVLK